VYVEEKFLSYVEASTWVRKMVKGNDLEEHSSTW
jgi:hypothetical protein